MGATFALAAEYIGTAFAGAEAAGAGAAAAGAGGGAAAGGAAAGAAAGGAAAGGGLGTLGTALATGVAGAVVGDMLAPDMPASPEQRKLGAAPDPAAQEAARKRSLAEQLTRRGRASTVLTSASGSLGG